MKVNILCVGYSILHHGPCADVFWEGDWGMAASCRENDYYHTLQRRLRGKYPDIEFNFRENGSYLIETSIYKDEEKDYTEECDKLFGASLEAMTPDIVTLQLGDNCPHERTTDNAFANAIISVVNYFKKHNPNVTVILCRPWYGELIDRKHVGTIIAARETEMPLVDLNQYHIEENEAKGLFKHNGVQCHPGDRGMWLIADEFTKAISKIIDSKFLEK
jgi:hypothetical protein